MWAAAGAVLELLALRHRRFPTLTATLRRWLGIHPRTPLGNVAPVAFVAGWLWLTVHLTRRVADVVDEHL